MATDSRCAAVERLDEIGPLIPLPCSTGLLPPPHAASAIASAGTARTGRNERIASARAYANRSMVEVDRASGRKSWDPRCLHERVIHPCVAYHDVSQC